MIPDIPLRTGKVTIRCGDVRRRHHRTGNHRLPWWDDASAVTVTTSETIGWSANRVFHSLGVNPST